MVNWWSVLVAIAVSVILFIIDRASYTPRDKRNWFLALSGHFKHWAKLVLYTVCWWISWPLSMPILGVWTFFISWAAFVVVYFVALKMFPFKGAAL